MVKSVLFSLRKQVVILLHNTPHPFATSGLIWQHGVIVVSQIGGLVEMDLLTNQISAQSDVFLFCIFLFNLHSPQQSEDRRIEYSLLLRAVISQIFQNVEITSFLYPFNYQTLIFVSQFLNLTQYLFAQMVLSVSRLIKS